MKRASIPPPAYPAGAYELVGAATDYTIKKLPEKRHVSARELLYGLCEYAEKEYGVMAPTVLRGLGLGTPKDVGRIVFDLIAAGRLSASENDRESDFDLPGGLFREVEGRDLSHTVVRKLE